MTTMTSPTPAAEALSLKQLQAENAQLREVARIMADFAYMDRDGDWVTSPADDRVEAAAKKARKILGLKVVGRGWHTEVVSK